MKNLYSKARKLSRVIVMILSALTLSVIINPQSVFAGELITFGTYPQTEVTSPSSDIKNASYDANGDAVIDGQKYRRVEDIEYGYTLEEVSTADGSLRYPGILMKDVFL